MNIPEFLSKDDYLQNPIMKRFIKEHELDNVTTRDDLIAVIEEYSNRSPQNNKEVYSWLDKIVKEGSKLFCYRKLNSIPAILNDENMINAKISEVYPICPMQSILDYNNTEEITLVNYRINTDKDGVCSVEFVFSNLFLCGEVNTLGEKTTLPVYIDIYVRNGFIVGRCKAKTTLFHYDEANEFLSSDEKVQVTDHINKIMDIVLKLFDLSVLRNKETIKTHNSKMLYNLYNKYSVTPPNVKEKVDSQREILLEFINSLFHNLNLNYTNIEKAIKDAEILIEKYISINGDINDDFKQNNKAYLVKVISDDESELTRIDTSSTNTVPLQTTEAFYDSKKTVVNSKMCRKLNFVFKRTDDKCFPKANLLVVQIGTIKDFGYMKTLQYAEEEDIQYVLQTIFENY